MRAGMYLIGVIFQRAAKIWEHGLLAWLRIVLYNAPKVHLTIHREEIRNVPLLSK